MYVYSGRTKINHSNMFNQALNKFIYESKNNKEHIIFSNLTLFGHYKKQIQVDFAFQLLSHVYCGIPFISLLVWSYSSTKSLIIYEHVTKVFKLWTISCIRDSQTYDPVAKGSVHAMRGMSCCCHFRLFFCDLRFNLACIKESSLPP